MTDYGDLEHTAEIPVMVQDEFVPQDEPVLGAPVLVPPPLSSPIWGSPTPGAPAAVPPALGSPASGWPVATPAPAAIPAASVTPDPPAQPRPGRSPVLSEGHPAIINCPECGAPGMVDPTRRDAGDFCAHCDFPLFWSRERIPVGEPADAGEDALRRLPGAHGRVVIASVPCPHCNELNLPSAVYCVRCDLAMQYTPPPPPPPVAMQPPAPEPPMLPPEEEPQRMWIWWVLLIAMFVLAGIGLVLAQHWYWWH